MASPPSRGGTPGGPAREPGVSCAGDHFRTGKLQQLLNTLCARDSSIQRAGCRRRRFQARPTLPVDTASARRLAHSRRSATPPPAGCAWSADHRLPRGARAAPLHRSAETAASERPAAAVEPANRFELRLGFDQAEQLAADRPLIVTIDRLAERPLIAQQTQPARLAQDSPRSTPAATRRRPDGAFRAWRLRARGGSAPSRHR